MASGLGIGRRGTQIVSKDSKHDGGNIKICNRIGCSTRHDSSLQGSDISKSEKLKCPKASFQPRSRNAVSGSSNSVSYSSNCRKPKEQQPAVTQDFQTNSIVSESSITQKLSGNTSARVTGKAKMTSKNTNKSIADRRHKKLESDNLVGSSDAAAGTLGNTKLNPFSASQNQTHRWIASRNRGTSSSSLSQHGATPGCTTSQPINHSHGQSLNLQRCKGKVGSSKEERSLSPRATPNLSLCHSPVSQPVTYRTRPRLVIDDVDRNSSRRVRNREFQRNVMNIEDSIYLISEQPLSEEVLQTQPSGAEVEVIRQSLLSLSESNPSMASSSEAAQSLRTRQISRLDDRVRRESARPFLDRDIYHEQTIDGIREVLLTLDRIEQDTDLSHEQLLLLETSLLLGSLGIPDQHRDMRLDIDHMSYEELLALGEKMGTVNTSLTEEAMLKCLKRSIYGPNDLVSDTSEDAKCSICQEEYAIGEEVGKLSCEHCYHSACINQWFQLKNWCPICKVSASPSLNGLRED